MAAPIQLAHVDDATLIRAEAAQETRERRRRRLLAIAHVLDGMGRCQAAELAGINRQSLRLWIKRYNELGIDGLKDLPRPGRPRFLTQEQRAELAQIIQRGPEPQNGQSRRWSVKALCRMVEKKFGAQYTLSGMVQLKRNVLIALCHSAMTPYAEQSGRSAPPDH